MEGKDPFISLGLTLSIVGHLFLAALVLFQFNGTTGELAPPVIYSVSLEGGKTLGGVAQIAKDDKKEQIAPVKKVQQAKEEEKQNPVKEEKKPEKVPEKVPEKSVEDAEVSLKENEKKVEPKPTPAKVETPPKETKKTEVKKTEKDQKKVTGDPNAANLNKTYQAALQRYLGESTEAGGQGFGAGRIGGNSMGGGIVRPPEFFVYKRVLEEAVKSGWHWHDVTAALVAQVVIDIEPDGRIRQITVERGSGNSEFDESVVRAIKLASPVPRPPDSVYQWFRSVRMTFDPRE